MMPDWMVSLAQGLFWVVTMTLLMRWLGRSRHRSRPVAERDRIQHPAGILAIGVIGTLFFAGVPVAARIWPDDSVNFWFYALFAGMTLMAVYIVADYFLARHEVSDEGMDFGRPTGRRVVFHWGEVRRIRFSRTWNWFRIELQSGDVVRVSGMMMGLPALADKALRHVPASRIDGDALQLLRNAAKDQLPPIWE
jgi:predicted permease